LRELIVLQPNELKHVFRLAKVQEDQQLIATAEDTLLTARREHGDAVEPYVMLAQFYSRRAMAVRRDADGQKVPAPVTASGEADEHGVYKIGGPVKAPSRVGTPQYPADALAAGIEGVVIAEIVVNEAGNVAEAKILRSVPLLDEAALNAVRLWQYAPTVVNGQAVPVRMTVTVNFSQTRNPPSQPPRP
jgi:protein TonB